MTDDDFRAAARAFTEKGARSHATTGSALLDYFAKGGTHRGRAQADVDEDYARCWAESPRLTLMVLFYLRLVTRRSRGLAADTEEVQKGQGARDEFRKGLVWLARHHRSTFDRNLWLVPLVGRWSDLWHEDTVDALPASSTYNLVADGLGDPFHRGLLAKNLPRIRSRANTHNQRHEALNRWALGLRKHLGWTEREYRKFKADPTNTAHTFQRQMCAGAWDQIVFGRIPGRALMRLVTRQGRDGLDPLTRHGQTERYLAWIQEQPTAKFTGYPYELYRAARRAKGLAQQWTLDRQFQGLIDLAKSDRGGIRENVWCALDTSGSMAAPIDGTVRAIDVCIGLGLYFSALNEGAFRNHVVLFDAKSRIVHLDGTFTQRVQKLGRMSTAWGTTNFQSVIDAIVELRTDHPTVPPDQFPTTLLVVSDMQFDPAGTNTKTNYEVAMRKLAAVGLPTMRIVWWWVTGRGTDFPSTLDDRGVILIGGFDGSVLELLLGGGPRTPAPTEEEAASPAPIGPDVAMIRALDQELLRHLTLGPGEITVE